MRIIAKNLVKIYGDRSVVNDVSFDVNKGEVVGLLGPNGAGKTTTFYMVVGLVRPNGGRIFIDDTDLTIIVDAAGIVDCESLLFTAICTISIGYDDRR